jgi:integrase
VRSRLQIVRVHDTKANADAEHEPVLDGPSKATLAQALDYYARNYSIAKGGVVAELNRINRYLGPAGLPMLKAIENDIGVVDIAEYGDAEIPKAWKAFNDRRRAARAGTYALFASLAVKRCNIISTTHIRELFVQMKKDGLSDSTIQKEIAMLKAMFNTAIEEWQWRSYTNPCRTIKVGKSDRRFVHLTKLQREELDRALIECDNPYFWPLVVMAKETTLRRGTLLKMQWSLVDLENRVMLLPGKVGQKRYSISKPVVELLAHLPRDPSGRVFPITANAVTMAWGRVRERANLPGLQYRDLRHLGATDWVRRGLSTHELRHVLGHSTIATAQFYVDLVGEDQLTALDQASEKGGTIALPPSSAKDAQTQRNHKRAHRLNRPQDQDDGLCSTASESVASVTDKANLTPQEQGRGRAAPSHERNMDDATGIFLLAHGQSQGAVGNVVQFRPRKAA